MTNDNDQIEFFVYTRGGRSFELDNFFPEKNMGIRIETFPTRKIIREFNFNGDQIICYEKVTTQKRELNPDKFWTSYSGDLNLEAFKTDNNKEEDNDK